MAKSKKRRRSLRGSADRYVVTGPATWRRSLHTTKNAAVDRAKECSKKHPNAICKVTYGLPGLQTTVAECNRSECYGGRSWRSSKVVRLPTATLADAATDRKTCSTMANDVHRLASSAAELADGARISGSVFGQGSSQIFYNYRCAQKGKFGPGLCSVWEIERSGPGVAKFGLRSKDTVGNLHGLTRQISRDLARMWCGAPEPTPGFEGGRRKKRKKNVAGRRRKARR